MPALCPSPCPAAKPGPSLDDEGGLRSGRPSGPKSPKKRLHWAGEACAHTTCGDLRKLGSAKEKEPNSPNIRCFKVYRVHSSVGYSAVTHAQSRHPRYADRAECAAGQVYEKIQHLQGGSSSSEAAVRQQSPLHGWMMLAQQ